MKKLQIIIDEIDRMKILDKTQDLKEAKSCYNQYVNSLIEDAPLYKRSELNDRWYKR